MTIFTYNIMVHSLHSDIYTILHNHGEVSSDSVGSHHNDGSCDYHVRLSFIILQDDAIPSEIADDTESHDDHSNLDRGEYHVDNRSYKS